MSDFIPGDKVEFLDDKTQGFVISILDKKRLLIEIEDGLEIPVHQTEVLRISKRKNENNDQVKLSFGRGSSDRNKDREASGIFIALNNEVHEQLWNVHLINDTEDLLLFNCYLQNENETQAINKGEVMGFDHEFLTKIDIAKYSRFPLMTLQILRFRTEADTVPPPLVFELKVKAKDLIKDQKEAPLLDKPCLLFKLDETKEIESEKPVTEKNKPNEIEPNGIRQVEKPPQVVDLHIDQINPNYEIMSKSEIFDFQFQYFINNLEKGIAFEYPNMVFIHGIGVSSLKNKIIQFLKKHPEVSSFQDADVRKYGYGATEVFLEQDS